MPLTPQVLSRISHIPSFICWCPQWRGQCLDGYPIVIKIPFLRDTWEALSDGFLIVKELNTWSFLHWLLWHQEDGDWEETRGQEVCPETLGESVPIDLSSMMVLWVFFTIFLAPPSSAAYARQEICSGRNDSIEVSQLSSWGIGTMQDLIWRQILQQIIVASVKASVGVHEIMPPLLGSNAVFISMMGQAFLLRCPLELSHPQYLLAH